ncbi:MAG TPA: SDR family NAD(P)-dependent oxidoreductase [Streptosporangiaceae bacterium]|nr:SDR family NAD(P)-dependent oxidoreductase [Streptosporangiaceae bacterium]
MAVKTWFITGTSRGFGREWATAALDRGDEVAATARDVASLDDLAAKYGERVLPIPLDVTDRDADFAAVKLAHDYFGRLDVIVNNAGYGQFGMVEEISESEIRAQMETNRPATPCYGWWTARTRRCACSWARRPWASRPLTTSHGWRPGANGSPWPPPPRTTEGKAPGPGRRQPG